MNKAAAKHACHWILGKHNVTFVDICTLFMPKLRLKILILLCKKTVWYIYFFLNWKHYKYFEISSEVCQYFNSWFWVLPIWSTFIIFVLQWIGSGGNSNEGESLCFTLWSWFQLCFISEWWLISSPSLYSKLFRSMLLQPEDADFLILCLHWIDFVHFIMYSF